MEEKTEVEPAGDPVPVEVQTFESPFGKVRAVVFSDGTPWFVAKDACEGLDLSSHNVSYHLRRLNSDQKMTLHYTLVSEKGVRDVLFLRGAQQVCLISRGGLNDFVMESRKPTAQAYRQWVTDEVLPALQDTGTFTDKGHPL